MVDIVEIKHEDFGGSKVDRSLPQAKSVSLVILWTVSVTRCSSAFNISWRTESTKKSRKIEQLLLQDSAEDEVAYLTRESILTLTLQFRECLSHIVRRRYWNFMSH